MTLPKRKPLNVEAITYTVDPVTMVPRDKKCEEFFCILCFKPAKVSNKSILNGKEVNTVLCMSCFSGILEGVKASRDFKETVECQQCNLKNDCYNHSISSVS